MKNPVYVSGLPRGCGEMRAVTFRPPPASGSCSSASQTSCGTKKKKSLHAIARRRGGIGCSGFTSDDHVVTRPSGKMLAAAIWTMRSCPARRGGFRSTPAVSQREVGGGSCAGRSTFMGFSDCALVAGLDGKAKSARQGHGHSRVGVQFIVMGNRIKPALWLTLVDEPLR